MTPLIAALLIALTGLMCIAVGLLFRISQNLDSLIDAIEEDDEPEAVPMTPFPTLDK